MGCTSSQGLNITSVKNTDFNPSKIKLMKENQKICPKEDKKEDKLLNQHYFDSKMNFNSAFVSLIRVK